jgi:hypothetical protein
MRICWDNINDFKYNKERDQLYKQYREKGGITYYTENESCLYCNDPYLTQKENSTYCSRSCQIKHKSPYGDDVEKRKNAANKQKITNKSKETKKKRSLAMIKVQSETKHKKSGKNCYMWKGGYKTIPLYDTYSHQLDFCEETRRYPDDENILEVRCTYCNKWHIPIVNDLVHRIRSINGGAGDCRFYCSEECKGSCDIYGRIKYPKGHKNNKYTREVQAQLRKLVLERDNWTCQKCDSVSNLHCHHYEGIEINPIESTDIDNCITLCKKCHKAVHKQEGCKYNQLKCK